MITIELTEREKDIFLIALEEIELNLGYLEYVEEEAIDALDAALLSLRNKTAHLMLSDDIDFNKFD